MPQEDKIYKELQDVLKKYEDLEKRNDLFIQKAHKAVTEVSQCRQLYIEALFQTEQIANTDKEKAKEIIHRLANLAKKTKL